MDEMYVLHMTGSILDELVRLGGSWERLLIGQRFCYRLRGPCLDSVRAISVDLHPTSAHWIGVDPALPGSEQTDITKVDEDGKVETWRDRPPLL